jgi:hypothetical protein
MVIIDHFLLALIDIIFWVLKFTRNSFVVIFNINRINFITFTVIFSYFIIIAYINYTFLKYIIIMFTLVIIIIKFIIIINNIIISFIIIIISFIIIIISFIIISFIIIIIIFIGLSVNIFCFYN